MFLRNIAKLLSLNNKSQRRSEQQIQQRKQKPGSPRTGNQAPRNVKAVREPPDVGASYPEPKPEAAQPAFYAEHTLNSPSVNSTSTATTSRSVDQRQSHPPYPLGQTLESTSPALKSTLTCSRTSAALEPALGSTFILDPADHNPVSNLPFRPHLQTLSPSIDQEYRDNIGTKQDSSLPTTVSILPASSLLHQHGNEPGFAMQRKVWVKRPGASATRVEVNEDDLVDNVRDVILHKYANSLGRHIDSPDITLKIVSREQANKNIALERVLGPEESIGRTLDTYYPGGQAIDEALIIEVPQKRTPKPSPRPGNHHVPYYIPEDYRPGDSARDYFPPMPMPMPMPLQSPRIAHVQHPAGPNGPIHSMSVLTTGQVPPLPSPGGQNTRTRHRPKYPRQHTSSPTILHNAQTNGIDGKSQMNGVNAPAPPLPTPPPVVGDKGAMNPPNRTTSPHSGKPKKKRQNTTGRDMNTDLPLPTKPASASLLDGRVPPINVLLVEDNVINLKLLEQFMKRLKVRWKSAMNGREAVNMWRKGGFHLVLMDIQLPVMNGLEATKEIRRLESVNGIGLGVNVFGEAEVNGKTNTNGTRQLSEEDKLEERDLFKSPVIIVALTASSLQSDRHEALAVGCNDFLTKPVNFVWMERKVTEWGCMQALIDFNGWRKWKAIAEKKESEDPEKRKQEEKDDKAKTKAQLRAMFSRPPPSKKDGPTETVNKNGESTSTSTNTATGASASSNNTDMPPTRRSHKANRSQSGNIVPSLGSTPELDEKDI